MPAPYSRRRFTSVLRAGLSGDLQIHPPNMRGPHFIMHPQHDQLNKCPTGHCTQRVPSALFQGGAISPTEPLAATSPREHTRTWGEHVQASPGK